MDNLIILADSDGTEIRYLDYTKIDIDLNDTRDFELTVSTFDWRDDIDFGSMIFIPNTEYGGIIGTRKTETAENAVIITGRTWRGILDKKIVEPPTGQDYRYLTGELNTVISMLIDNAGLSGLFGVSTESTGVDLSNYQVNRYDTLLTVLYNALKSKNYRLDITYNQTSNPHVVLSAQPIVDHSSEIELSQDNNLNFALEEIKNGVNHLICLGKGELKEREVINLYIAEDGSVGTTPYYTGIDDVTEVYEDTSTDELQQKGTEKLLELASKQIFGMDVVSLDLDIAIGDIVGGRDYITGMAMAKPIVNKIYRIENGKKSIEYELEGDEQ